MRARSKLRFLLGLAAIGLAWACWGQTATESDGGAQQDGADSVGTSDAAPSAPSPSGGSGSSGGSSGSLGSSSGGSPSSSSGSATTGPTFTVDAAAPAAGDAASTTCAQEGGGSSGGGSSSEGGCSSMFQETCGNTIYQVSCACPRGSCVCFGPTTTVVSFTGCPSCPGLPLTPNNLTGADALALCGFPH